MPASSSHRIPTARDIPPVTLTNIPIVDAAEFEPYLAQVGALYEQLRRVKESEDEAANSQRNSKHEEQHDSGSDNLLRPKSMSHRRGSASSITSLASLEAPNISRRASSGVMRKAAQGPPPLSTIPTVYFDEDFHLENPRTFDVVSERSEVIPTQPSDKAPSAPPRKALATNAILQEKLSWYMDTIEVHLINSISTASTTFFTALGSLKELHSEATESVERIEALRRELEALDEEMATSGLLIVQKRQRQENLRQLNDAVSQLRYIVEGVAHCESLVDADELDQALSSFDSLEKLMAGERDETEKSLPHDIVLRDLRGASALQTINQDLNTLRFRVGKAFETQFISVLLTDLRRHAESVAAPDVLSRWSSAASRQRGGHSRSASIFPAYLTHTEDLKAQLMPHMVGLHRARSVVAAAVAYRDTVLREIRSLVRRPLPSSSEDDNESMLSVSTTSGSRRLTSQEKSANLARSLRALGPEDAEELLVKVYIGVTETLRRLTTQVKVLLDIASSLSSTPSSAPDEALKSPPPRSPVTSPRFERSSMNLLAGADMELQEELHKSLDMNSLLTQAVDIANDKIVKILRVRAEQATNLPLGFFLRYFTLNLYFANECEAISGRSGTSLKNVVNGHIKEFVQRNRDAEMQKLAQGMEADQWNAKDFSENDSQLLGMILSSATQDSTVWTENNKIWIPYRDLEKLATESSAAEPAEPAEPNGTSKDKTRSAVIETEKFMLPNSAILCLNGMGNFLSLIASIPSMTTDVASSLIAYLQLFNSRCTQLILGAGATRSAGLKNITTKHLALASQGLSFTATLVPHVREFVRGHAGSSAGVSNLMSEFDKIRRLLQEHQSSIYQKLVDIMNGRAALHAKSMRTIDWDTSNADSVHSYMEILAKETTTLHRVLTKNLPETCIQTIMTPVFARYKEQLGAPFREATPKTEAGQQSMLRDVEFFSTKLGKIEGFGDAGDFLADIVKAKEVRSKTPEPAKEEAVSKEATVEEAAPEDVTSKTAVPEETPPTEADPKESAPEEGVAKEAEPKEATPEEAEPKEAEVKEAAPAENEKDRKDSEAEVKE
ncbi:related to VPS54-subunit of VP51-54 complex,required for protein sorting at the yeast late Golgi [Claviceps purpurea 20.1]|uniref:Vacuolar protein sorting-associated protein 54 n=1 Tax=Claviceps purpurea (strain 20.1) TaxID=1111077 RepID=M1WAI0_CLAP2|nr:related to VPS54-subunit of VP51-54 complex,required for protein sorting at the yeast late Golgi [Claviceps purpurea 20.1]